jgi:hypothetical protein
MRRKFKQQLTTISPMSIKPKKHLSPQTTKKKNKKDHDA